MGFLMDTVAGWGAALPPWTCRLRGVPFNLDGYDVEAVLRDDTGTEVTTTGMLSKLNQTTHPGRVQFTPAADGSTFNPETFTVTRNKKTYTVHVKVTDGDGRPVFFPDDEAAEIIVHRR